MVISKKYAATITIMLIVCYSKYEIDISTINKNINIKLFIMSIYKIIINIYYNIKSEIDNT